MKKRIRSLYKRFIKYRFRRRCAEAKRKMERLGGFRINRQLKPMFSGLMGNELLRDAITSGQPLMVSRHGLYELRSAISGRTDNTADHACVIRTLHRNAGFFPKDAKLIPEFSRFYLECCRDIDILAVWLYRNGMWKEEESVVNEFCPASKLVDLKSLDSFRYDSPWTGALAGKRVLVVHPFEHSIRVQYEKRHKLFANPSVLPDFAELLTVKAVQSIAGNSVQFDSWFLALESMKQQISSLDFDVAIIGAGAYGLPLASHVKSIGKQGIHLGGITQMLFGILGKRWIDKYPDLPNDNWVRPSDDEKPKNFQRIEGGCYW